MSFEFGESGSGARETDATDNEVHVFTPQASSSISSPFTVKGEARGTWYFEGEFPIRLSTSDGTVLAEVPATALGDWMVEEFVPFEVSVAFSSTTATSGTLVLTQHDPSMSSGEQKEVRVPVIFAH